MALLLRLPKSAVFLLFVFVIHTNSQKSRLIQLDEANWSQMLEGEWMVEFFAPWCPACKSMQSIWEDFSNWSKDLDIHVGQVDVTTNPGLSGRFMVTALPTIFHVKDGQFRQYRGSRDKETFINFIEEKKWEALDTLSGFFTPSSIQMSIVSYFFKLSMILRNIHTQLVEQYHFPFWASILTFAVVTIAVGAILGLMLVCVMDMLYPPKHRPHPHKLPTPPQATPDSEGATGESGEDTNVNKKSEDEAEKSQTSEAESSPKSGKENVRKRKKGKKTKVEE